MIDATLELLATGGVPAVSPAAVGAAVGLEPQEVEARWGGRAALVSAAVASLLPSARPVGAAPLFEDLESELLAFRRSMAHRGALAAAAVALDEAGDPELARLYRDQVLRPQRSRLRRILELAKRQGLLDADDNDLDTAVACCTGSWYALAVAGVRPPRDWAAQVARLTWRSLGGRPPA